MSSTRFSSKLYNLQGFQDKFLPVVYQSVATQFATLKPLNELNNREIDLNYLLTCASVFSSSENPNHLDAAFRIAQYCLTSEEVNDSEKTAAAIILDTMTNVPAIKLAIERGYLSSSYEKDIPLFLQLAKVNRGIEFSLADLNNNRILPINRFQLDVYKESEKADILSISAPTSAGKSFILLELICEHLASAIARIVVYLVPTRSLIQQVELDLYDSFSSHRIKDVYITTVPIKPQDIDKRTSQLYILTQERFQWLLNDEPDLKPNLILVDEAQKIGDGSRGILLQQVIEEVQRRSTASKIIFSSPMTENPEILLEQAPKILKKGIVKTNHITVNQNLIWVSQVPRKPKLWEMDLCNGDETIHLGKFELTDRPNPVSKRLSLVAHSLGNQFGGNLIYVNGPSDPEKTARQLWDLQGEENETNDQDLLNLISLTKSVINKRYTLAVTLSRGIGFHYGNIPLIIKNEIERLFKIGKIKYLVCTSTLIEGINLPARSIFVRGPKKGIHKPMGEIDFWNLAGRAGRQGKEFQGNVVCIDPNNEDVWKVPPPRNKAKYVIQRSVDDVIKDGQKLIEFILAGTPRSEAAKYPELEHGFVYLLGEHLRYDSLSNSPHIKHHEKGLVVQLERLLTKILTGIEIPRDIILKNPGVSPIAQQHLLNYFKHFDSNIENLIPTLPESEDAFNSYKELIETISQYLSGDHPKLTIPYTILVLSWMNGYGLSRIIDNNWKYWGPRGKKLQTVIRDTMHSIEEYARFKFVKYSSCYTDVLKYFLESQGRIDLLDEIPEMNIWLELGASQGTQVSLMSIGLSRTSAISLSELIIKDNLTPKECISWLLNQEIDTFDLSPIIIQEIKRVISLNINNSSK